VSPASLPVTFSLPIAGSFMVISKASLGSFARHRR
jgi:hypothetical protein